MPHQVGREFRPWWKRGQPAKFGNLNELQESKVYLLLNPRLDKAAKCVPFFNVYIYIFWASGNTTACFPAMSYSSSSQVVLAMSYPTFGPCLKTSISVSLVIVVGADEEQLRGTGGGIEVTMTIWNACKHSSERTPCPKKEGCTKSSSHLATRLIKVSQNCSAKPSSLLLGPPRWTTLCSQFKVLAFFSELQNDAIGICQGLKRLSILYIKHHLAPGPVKIKWKKTLSVWHLLTNFFMSMHNKICWTSLSSSNWHITTGAWCNWCNLFFLRFFRSWLRLMGLLRVLLSQFILLNFQLIFRQQHCRQDDVQMVLQRGHSMQLTWP